MEINRVGTFTTRWGESLVWDERRSRLMFVDCGTRTIHWLDGGDEDPQTFHAPSMPTGVVPTTDGRFVVVMEDGLYLFDVDAASIALLSRYPESLGGRCNDACADLDGHLITGRLNLGPEEGSAWWFAPSGEWRLLDDDISNTNGPNVAVLDGEMTLIIGDTSAHYFAYPYDPPTGRVGPRRVFGDMDALPAPADPSAAAAGGPDGATFDRDGGLWCALFGRGQVVRFTVDGLDRTIDLDVVNPTDVAFGGPELDRLYVTSVAGEPGVVDGALLVIDGLGVRGRPEPRFAV